MAATANKVLLIGDVVEKEYKDIQRELKLPHSRRVVRIGNGEIMEANTQRQKHLHDQAFRFTRTLTDAQQADELYDDVMREEYETAMGCSFDEIAVYVIDRDGLRALSIDGSPLILPDEFAPASAKTIIIYRRGKDLWYEASLGK